MHFFFGQGSSYPYNGILFLTFIEGLHLFLDMAMTGELTKLKVIRKIVALGNTLIDDTTNTSPSETKRNVCIDLLIAQQGKLCLEKRC